MAPKYFAKMSIHAKFEPIPTGSLFCEGYGFEKSSHHFLIRRFLYKMRAKYSFVTCDRCRFEILIVYFGLDEHVRVIRIRSSKAGHDDGVMRVKDRRPRLISLLFEGAGGIRSKKECFPSGLLSSTAGTSGADDRPPVSPGAWRGKGATNAKTR